MPGLRSNIFSEDVITFKKDPVGSFFVKKTTPEMTGVEKGGKWLVQDHLP